MKMSNTFFLIAFFSFASVIYAEDTSANGSMLKKITVEQRFEDAFQYVNELMVRVKAVPVGFFDKTFSLQAGEVFARGLVIVMGAVVGHLVTAATYNLLGGNQRPMFVQNPKTWTLPMQIGTGLGTGMGAYFALKESYFNGLVNAVDEKLLGIVIVGEQDKAAFFDAIDRLNVSDRFPRALGFYKLELLRSRIATIITLFEGAKDRSYGDQVKALLPELQLCLRHIEDAMVMLKKDTNWFEECNAANYAQMQSTMSAHHNAQLAGAVVQLAHASR